jgi:Holliday junction resolvase
MTHAELVEIGVKWLRTEVGVLMAVTEQKSSANEIPDILAYKGGHSILIECKVSHEDFIADRRKPSRISESAPMGCIRHPN